MILLCKKCKQKYISESSAKRCCTVKTKEIKNEILIVEKVKRIKKTPEEIKVYNRKRYLENRDSILEQQKVRDQRRKNKTLK